jgi:hypothetical protein
VNAAEPPRCETCAYFTNDAETLESAIPGMRSLASGFAAVRDRDGLCSLHERYLPASAQCARHTGLSQPPIN